MHWNVSCLLKDRTSCVEGSVYLLGGDGVTRGRVQYCYNGAWHSVCADNWDTTGIEARVICESAGYDTSGYGKPIARKDCICL